MSRFYASTLQAKNSKRYDLMNPGENFIKCHFVIDQRWLQNQNLCFTNDGKKEVFNVILLNHPYKIAIRISFHKGSNTCELRFKFFLII